MEASALPASVGLGADPDRDRRFTAADPLRRAAGDVLQGGQRRRLPGNPRSLPAAALRLHAPDARRLRPGCRGRGPGDLHARLLRACAPTTGSWHCGPGCTGSPITAASTSCAARTPTAVEAIEALVPTSRTRSPRAEQRDALRRLIADVQRLPDQQRSALLMRELSGMTYADVVRCAGRLDPGGQVAAGPRQGEPCAGQRGPRRRLRAYPRGPDPVPRPRRAHQWPRAPSHARLHRVPSVPLRGPRRQPQPRRRWRRRSGPWV